MSKKTKMLVLSATVFAFALSITTVNAKGYGMAGCGLGSIVMGSSDGQILAGTTNGTSGNQTFAITTGTSNCVENKAAYNKMQQEVFVSVNFKSLEQEMAAGKGQKIDALANLMGCPSSFSKSFGETMQSNHSVIFNGSEKLPSEVIALVKSEMNKNTALTKACQI